jgi:hypothetical protein
MAAYGEMSWDDTSFDRGKKTDMKELYLRLQDGSNEVRIVTQPYQYLVHTYKREGDRGFGSKVKCSAVHGSCPLCDLGDKAKPRWLLGVIDRRTASYKVLDMGYSVFSQIRKLATSARWGNPAGYDVDIIKDKNAPPTQFYVVQPCSKEPMSATDQDLKDKADLDVLKRQVTPLTPEQVQKRLDFINGAAVPQKSSPDVAAAAATQAATPATTDDDDDDDFPSYDA